jgi:hypothetical protein
MTEDQPDVPEIVRIGCYLSLESAIAAAKWIDPSDMAAVTLARRVATALDTAFDMGADLKDLTALSGRFLSVLQQLHLTTETRTASKKIDENDGTEYVGDFLRLVNTKNTKSTAKTAKRRPVSKPASG